MIETHVVNALILKPLKDEVFYKMLTFINGLVAPSFLFCAGFALAIMLQRKWEDFTRLRYPLWRYVVRLLFILVVAYSLHLPFFSLTHLRQLTDDNAWIPFYQADILQVIALTLLGLVVFAVICRTRTTFLYLTSLVTLAIIFSSPIVREMDHSGLPIWLRPYLTMQFKSQFPLFPWAAFLMSGTIAGYFFLKAKAEHWDAKFMNNMGMAALAAIVLSVAIEYLPVTIYPDHDFWRASPEFFFVRLALVALAGFGLWRYEQKRGASTSSVMSVFGQESLLVYVVHLLIVYGNTHEWSLVRIFGPTLNYVQCLGVLVGLTAAMYLMAYIWHWVKMRNARAAKVIQFAVLATIVVVFLVKPD